MKLKGLIYFFSILTALSLASDAMDNPDDLKLEELRKIVVSAFPSLIYNPGELHSDKNEKFLEAQKYREIQSGSHLFMLPQDSTAFLLHCLDSKTLLLGLGTTCKFFNTAIQSSCFYLNAECLRETMPHSIPEPILIRKAMNTKGGVFLLANLYSVSAQDLFTWFGPVYLNGQLAKKELLPSTLQELPEALPASFQDLSEEQLVDLYPVLKVALAGKPSETNNPERHNAIMQLLREYPNNIFVLPLHIVRLLSIYRDEPSCNNALDILSQFFQLMDTKTKCLKRARSVCSHSNYEAKDIIIRDLLMAGHNVPTVNSCYFTCSPEKKKIAIQIIQWCCDHQWDRNSSTLIRDAKTLNEPDLAFQILLKVIDLPDINNSQCYLREKYASFILYAHDKRVKKPINEFSQRLYDQHLENSNFYIYEKKDALSLYIRSGNEVCFRSAFSALITDDFMISGHPNDELIKDLYDHGFEEEAEKLIRLILGGCNTGGFLPSINSFSEFIDRAIKVDRETLLSKIKTALDVPFISLDQDEKMLTFAHPLYHAQRMNILTRLAFHEKDNPEEVDYIMQQVNKLYEDWKIYDLNEADNNEYDFSIIYYYFNQVYLCNFHYLKSVDLMLSKNEVVQSKFLDHIKGLGFNVSSLEETKALDPFEVIPLNIKKNQNSDNNL